MSPRRGGGGGQSLGSMRGLGGEGAIPDMAAWAAAPALRGSLNGVERSRGGWRYRPVRERQPRCSAVR
eukprot:jgi/Ulvmu1/5930/UM026_0052.1